MLVYVSIMLAGFTFFYIFQIRSDRSTVSLETADRLQMLEEVLISADQRIEELENKIISLEEAFEEVKEDPQALSITNLEADVKQVSQELTSLKEALGSDFELALSVPLLRKDIQKIEEQLVQKTESSSNEIDRIYDQNKWFLGLMGTMALGLIGLAFSNFLQTRKKEGGD